MKTVSRKVVIWALSFEPGFNCKTWVLNKRLAREKKGLSFGKIDLPGRQPGQRLTTKKDIFKDSGSQSMVLGRVEPVSPGNL